MTCTRPAEAGRVLLALAISAALHAAALIPPGAESHIQAGLPLRLILRTGTEADPDIPAIIAPAAEQLQGASTEAPGTPRTVSIHELVLPIGTAARYYLANELDVRPQIRTRVNPDYPRTAAELGIAANLVIRIYINETGRVEKVAVPEDGSSSLFADAIKAAFMKASYTPGIRDGKPVKSLVLIEVNFETADETAALRGGRY